MTIQFNNSYRILSISGADERKVEAAYQEMNKIIFKNISSFAWINWEFVLYFIAIIITTFVVKIILERIINPDTERDESTSITSISFTLSNVIVMLGSIFIPINFSEIFPEFILTSNDVDWIDRNANLMGFIGLLITIASPLCKFALGLLKINKRQINKAPEEV